MPSERKTIFFSLNVAYFEIENEACIVRKDRYQLALPNIREFTLMAPSKRFSIGLPSLIGDHEM
jgi:hypothetical protein